MADKAHIEQKSMEEPSGIAANKLETVEKSEYKHSYSAGISEFASKIKFKGRKTELIRRRRGKEKILWNEGGIYYNMKNVFFLAS